MIIEKRVCDLCYDDNEEIEAVAVYVDVESIEHDICEKHLELVKAQKDLLWRMI